MPPLPTTASLSACSVRCGSLAPSRVTLTSSIMRSSTRISPPSMYSGSRAIASSTLSSAIKPTLPILMLTSGAPYSAINRTTRNIVPSPPATTISRV